MAVEFVLEFEIQGEVSSAAWSGAESPYRMMIVVNGEFSFHCMYLYLPLVSMISLDDLN